MTFSKDSWWEDVEPEIQDSLQTIWVAVGLPGFFGEKKADHNRFLDERFGAGGWRIRHYVRGKLVSKLEALHEYEQSYRVYLRHNPEIVAFLTNTCGNVYDDNPSNVHDTSYEQPHTHLNHYQDISVRRVIAELAEDPVWPDVIKTSDEDVDLIDLTDGETKRVPRAMGFGGKYLLQLRFPDTPGFLLNPAVIPVYDPALIVSHPRFDDWYLQEGCQHLSVEAFWQMSKVIEVRYDRFLRLGEQRFDPLGGLD